MIVKRRGKILSCALAVVVLFSACRGQTGRAQAPPVVVRLAAPQNAMIEDFATNEYKLWLEAQTGLRLEMTWLPAEDAIDIANKALTTGEGLPDAYIGFGGDDIFKQPNLQTYIDLGTVIPLDGYIEKYGVHTKEIYTLLDEFHVEELMKSGDGRVYFMPGFSYSLITRYSQILWLNQGWLDALGLPQPTTTDELYQTLLAFKTGDPNGNGLPDEIPLAGTEEAYSKQVYDNLMNAFVYNDPKNARLFVEGGVVRFAPETDEWREGLAYLRTLYVEELLSPLSFSQSDQSMIQMANDPRDILGGFTVSGITYTVNQSSPEVLRRYDSVAPLQGPGGAQFATVSFPLPKPNGVITSACEHPEEVFKLFDLMLSEEGSLSKYGTQGVDWDYAEEGDVSIYGTPATIRLYHQIWKTVQNKNLMSIEPYVRRPQHNGGVTWDGNEADGEYINAQAVLKYVPYEPDELLGALIFEQDEMAEMNRIKTDLEVHVKAGFADFITGRRDIADDAEWALYLNEFDAAGLERFLAAAQRAFDRLYPDTYSRRAGGPA